MKKNVSFLLISISHFRFDFVDGLLTHRAYAVPVIEICNKIGADKEMKDDISLCNFMYTSMLNLFLRAGMVK